MCGRSETINTKIVKQKKVIRGGGMGGQGTRRGGIAFPITYSVGLFLAWRVMGSEFVIYLVELYTGAYEWIAP